MRVISPVRYLSVGAMRGHASGFMSGYGALQAHIWVACIVANLHAPGQRLMLPSVKKSDAV